MFALGGGGVCNVKSLRGFLSCKRHGIAKMINFVKKKYMLNKMRGIFATSSLGYNLGQPLLFRLYRKSLESDGK